MSYRINYDKKSEKYEVKKDTDVFPWFLAAFGLFLIMIFSLRAESPEALREILIPGEDSVTLQAFHSMTDDLRSGATITDAIECFCRTVLHDK